MILVFLVLFLISLISFSILFISQKIHPILFLVLETLMFYQCIAAKSLFTESMKVYRNLRKNEIEKARTAVSMIVGRDTDILDEEGIAKAAVETVAESTNDGVVAPIFFLAIFGAIGGMIYKAINTMDSMIAYKNEKYLQFGFFAAKLDDLANFIPSRICAFLMILISFLFPKFSGKNALKIFLRDRKKHASPNSAQSESVMAGALGLQLAGNTVYDGIIEKKDFIGDKLRSIEPNDIFLANIIMYMTTIFITAISILIRVILIN